MSITDLTAVQETIHNVLVTDPYRWLEGRCFPETEEWIKGQRERCDNYFATCNDLDAIRARVRKYLDVETVDQPIRVGGSYFYRRRNPGQEQPCIYVMDANGAHQRLLVDPSEGGMFASASIYRVSDDGSLLAYELKCGGEDRTSIHFVEVNTGRLLPSPIEIGYARGLAFMADNRSFCYCHEVSKESQEHTIYLRLFEEPAVDRAIFRVARSRGSRLVLTADAIHLGSLYIHERDGELLGDFWIADLQDPENWHKVFVNKKLPFNPILKHGQIFAITYDEASNGRLVELTKNSTECRTLIPEQDVEIRQVAIIGDKVFAYYLREMCPFIRCWSIAGQEQKGIDLPANCTVRLLSNYSNNSIFYSCESFGQPPIIFEYCLDLAQSKVWHTSGVSIDQSSINVQKNYYPSRDGTDIPITLVSVTNREAVKPSSVIMTGYGGFGASMTPQFSVLVSIMMECGVIFALPHIRGGGEFGRAWHEAARARSRQIAFDDFLSAGEWLCNSGITNPERLAIFGGSNSGLLVGVAMTQRPDLFRAVLCIAPLLDMVRYEHFDQAIKWRKEYGTVSNEEDFYCLLSYSPYHHIQDHVNYPAVLFVSGDKDDRCNPAHVRKMAARLLGRASQESPILVDYSDERGHSPVLPLSVRIEALSRRVAFLCRELNLSFSEGV
jgi:prolyl oligopeptidase